jgi:chromosome segregation ATPase
MGTTFGIIASLAGSVISGIGQISAAEARADRAEMNQALARQEAQRAAERASTQKEAAIAEAERKRRRARRRIGRQAAGFAAGGVTLEGTPTEVLADQAVESEIEVQQSLFEGELASLQSERSAQRARVEAAQAGSRASSARQSGLFQAGGTIIGGGIKAGRRTGLFSSGGGSGSSASTGGFEGVAAATPRQF